MADLAASNITVTILQNGSGPNGRKRMLVKLAFGNGALTYPAGGVPITKAKLGCPNTIESLVVFDKSTSGYAWSYDRDNEKLVAIQGDNDAVADGPGNQPSTVAIAAQTLHAEIIGW